jgi:hypothetical protein
MMDFAAFGQAPTPDDNEQALWRLGVAGDIRAFEVRPWPGVRALETYEFHGVDHQPRHPVMVSIRHRGQQPSDGGWVRVTTWQPCCLVDPDQSLVRRRTVIKRAEMEFWHLARHRRVWDPPPDGDDVAGSLLAEGFAPLDTYGPLRTWMRELGDGTAVVVNAVGLLPSGPVTIQPCDNFAQLVLEHQLGQSGD